MKEFETGAVRDTGGKGRMDLLPMCALIRVSKHMEDALTHYPERNWELGLPMHSMLDSAMRHLSKYMDGQTDEDHLCAAATNLLMALWTEEKRPEMQDIPTRRKEGGRGGNGGVAGVVMCYGGGGFLLTPGSSGSNGEDEGVCEHFNKYGRCNATKETELCMVGGKASRCFRMSGTDDTEEPHNTTKV